MRRSDSHISEWRVFVVFIADHLPVGTQTGSRPHLSSRQTVPRCFCKHLMDFEAILIHFIFSPQMNPKIKECFKVYVLKGHHESLQIHVNKPHLTRSSVFLSNLVLYSVFWLGSSRSFTLCLEGPKKRFSIHRRGIYIF